jgi:glutathione S-transferase
MTDSKIVFWQMRPLWGLPNASPFCMKLETWLRMAGLPYEAKAIQGPPKSSSGKLPYLERPDGSALWDSSCIIETLTREHGVTLDAHLSANDRAIGTLLQRTFEEDLYFVVLHERWVEDEGFRRVGPDYFGHFPWALRAVVPFIRRKIVAAAHGQGVARLPEGHRIAKGRADLSAIAQLLGDKPYFFGEPSSYDAIAYSFLANVLWPPIQGPLAQAMRAHANLVAYCERMKTTYYADWKSV